MLAMLLFASPIAYADDPPDDESNMKVDIGIGGDLEVDIGISGSAELNVGVEGPSRVHIDAGDEVELDVEASDESQVFIDDQNLDNNAQEPDEQESVVPIISAVFPAAGLLAFFLFRRRAKNNTNKGDNQLTN